MHSYTLVFSILSMATCLSAQNNYYLPQVVDGIVPNGGLVTAIVVTNTAKAPATISIAATRDDSSARPLTLSGLRTNTRFTAKLGPGATRLFITDGSGDGTAGTVVVSSDVALSVSEILSNIDVTGNPLSESSASGLTDQDLALEYMIPVDATGNTNTGVALYNPSSLAATVTLNLVDASGQPAGSASLTLGPKGHTTRFTAGDLFPAVSNFRGVLDISSKAKLAALAVRQNSASPAYTLLPAVNRIAHRMRFLLPQITDGPTSSGILQTTFLFTNLSAQPASVDLSLTANDGTPLAVNIPGVDSNSTFHTTIAPGNAVFWQTDGASQSLSTGAAVIKSTQPISVAAVITASDGQGGFLSETGLNASPVDFQFKVPFDNASNTTTGAAFFNAGAKPVTLTLNLLDPDGNQVASTQLAPLPPGARVTGMIPDFFSDAGTSSGALVATTGSPMDATLSAYILRQSQAGAALSSSLAVRLPRNPSGIPAAVVTKLDTTRQASASIPTSGGALSVTDTKGNKFTLTLPPGALLNRETITMTAISSATGITAPGLVAGVQLEPDGLGLLQPALLKIELASPHQGGTLPIGWHGAAPGVYLNPPLRDPSTLTVALTHFSGAGMGGFDLTSELINIANEIDFYNSLISSLTSQAHDEAVAGDADSANVDFQRALDALSLAYDNVIEPFMELALASDDEDVMRCAAPYAIAFERQRILLGNDEADDAINAAINDFLGSILARSLQKTADRCQKHDFTAYFDAIAAQRQAQLWGLSTASADFPLDSCLPMLELTYKSEIMGDIPVGVTGSFDATISAKVILRGSFTKEMLTQVTDPSKDLYTSFKLSGSAVESYDAMTIQVNGVPSGCSVTVSAKTPDTLTIKEGSDPKLSQVKFKFNPHYDPQAVTLNGQQLCSFCPVYRKTPVEVDLMIDPGKPSETLLATCKGVATPIPGTFWFAGWATNHAAAGDNGYIQNWDLQNTPDLFAQKSISESNTGPSATLTEKTDLKLKYPTQ